MRPAHLRQRYKELVNQLHSTEKTIITLRGELKWEPTAPATLFDQYDGAVNDRTHLEEELYDLARQMQFQRKLDESAGERNKVIALPSSLFPKRLVH